MTVFQPTTASANLTKILAIMIVLVFASAIGLVIFYNRFVNLEHGISDLGRALKAAQADNAELKDKIFAQFTVQTLEAAALERGLVQDRAPEYITLEHTPKLLSVRDAR